MPNLAVIQLMRVIIWPQSDSDGSYVKINVRGNKGFYSMNYEPPPQKKNSESSIFWPKIIASV